jgi:hypothetical protein
MRMWMINPKFLCRKHLLGEHGELHKHKWTFEKRHKKDNYIKNNCIEPKSMKKRHDELAKEIVNRSYKHNSPFTSPDISYLPIEHQEYKINLLNSIQDLHSRCSECLKLYQEQKSLDISKIICYN